VSEQPHDVMVSFLHEIQCASAMTLFLLSSIATSRREQYVGPGVTHPIMLTGLPSLCISPDIMNVPDDDLFGPSGTAAQMVYKAWIVEVYKTWETRYRNAFQASFPMHVGRDGVIRPQMAALGDLRHIRNDLLHSRVASVEHCGKCAVLKWFKPGERMVFRTDHILDFLNQMGILAPRTLVTQKGTLCTFNVFEGHSALLDWSPKPQLVSVRTLDVGREEDPPFKGVVVVFDNGLSANMRRCVTSPDEWDALGSARVTRTGVLVFDNGFSVGSDRLYQAAVGEQGSHGSVETSPIPGPTFKLLDDRSKSE